MHIICAYGNKTSNTEEEKLWQRLCFAVEQKQNELIFILAAVIQICRGKLSHILSRNPAQ